MCGDGLIVGSEICDDHSNDGIGCSIGCLGMSDGWACSLFPNGTSKCTAICGDGRVIPTFETCDDGPSNHVPPFTVQGCVLDCSGADTAWNCSGGD